MVKKKASAKSKGGGRKSAAKGGGYERWCAKELSLWITNDSTEDAVWRSAASGAKATMQAKGGDAAETHVGDLIPVMTEAFPFFETFAVECKRVRLLQWRSMFNPGVKCNIQEFWNQAVSQSACRIPLLIMREDNGVDLLAASTFLLEGVTQPLSKWIINGQDVSIVPLSTILNHVHVTKFVESARLYRKAIIGEG